jgi:cytochrome c peroxidase
MRSFVPCFLVALGSSMGLPACSTDARAPRHGHDDHAHDDSDGGATPDRDDGAPQPVSDAAPALASDGGGHLALVVPALFPQPKIPDENPLTIAKVELGRRLFYDKRLSGNQSESCASCHQQEKAFTDGRSRGIGSTGARHPRGSMSLANVAYATTLTWANPALVELERQALVPMFGETPVELGMAGQEVELVNRLRAERVYGSLFTDAFPDEADPFTVLNVTYALSSFERTLLSGDSPYDHYLSGETSALDAAQSRGMDLFFGERLECFHCHGDFALTDSATFVGKAFDESAFHNTGLYDVDGKGAYPAESQGLIEFTHLASDMGRFKAPTLRNIAVTAPYMHDGSIGTLDEVFAHYAAGGRTIPSGPNAGIGSQNPYRSEFVTGFTLTDDERVDLTAFLGALTDEAFLKDPRFSDPWK